MFTVCKTFLNILSLARTNTPMPSWPILLVQMRLDKIAICKFVKALLNEIERLISIIYLDN